MTDISEYQTTFVVRIYGGGGEIESSERSARQTVSELALGGNRLAALAAESAPLLALTPIEERVGDPFPDLDSADVFLATPRDADQKDVAQLVSKTWDSVAAFNERELDAVFDMTPATVAAGNEENSAICVLRGERLWLRDHLLLERLSLFAALEAGGLQPEETVVFAKADVSEFARRVEHTLRSRGYSVVPEEELREYVMQCTRSPTCVIDDGGTLIAQLLAQGRSDSAKQSIRPLAIETTTKGMRILTELGFQDAVIDLATSPVKLGLSRAIATSFVRELLILSRHSLVDGTKAIVFGYGNLGENVVQLLEAVGIACTVIEPRSERRRAAAARVSEAVEDIDQLKPERRFHWVIGCSGVRSIGPEVLAMVLDNGILAAVSSQDLVPILTAYASVLEITPYGRRLRLNEGVVKVFGDGHALNLFRAEGVPEPDFDRFQAQIVATLLTALSDVRHAEIDRPA